MPSENGHESDGVREGWVMFAAVGIAILIPLIMIGVWAVYRSWAGKNYVGLTAPVLQRPENKPLATFPHPQLIKASGQEWRAVRAEQEKMLNSYGWVDAPKGVVRIPIERAMDLLVERGSLASSSNAVAGPSEYELTVRRRLDSNAPPLKEIK